MIDSKMVDLNMVDSNAGAQDSRAKKSSAGKFGWGKVLAFSNDKTHDWVRFHNPRNQRLKVTACSHCGIVKGPISKSISCRVLDDGNHGMRRNGWEQSVA